MAEVASSIQDKRVQLCGQITGLDREQVEAQFSSAKEDLKQAGARFVFNPVEMIAPETSHAEAMRICLRWLVCNADVAVALPGYLSSLGASLETEVAHACGIPVMTLENATKGSG